MMARLRNRQLKATFWTDGELLRWHRDKRWVYQSVWDMAEDSGCVEDDPFEWKLTAWGSPLDVDMTVEVIEQYRDEFVAAHKLVPYEAEGKRYLFCKNFHQHERPRNPQSPDLPLPPWVKWTTKVTKTTDGREHRTNLYEVDTDVLTAHLRVGTDQPPTPSDAGTDVRDQEGSVPTSFGNQKGSPVLSGPVLSGPVLSIPVGVAKATAVDEFADIDFGEDEEGGEKPPEPTPPVQERGTSSGAKRSSASDEPETAQTLVAFLVDHAAEKRFALTGQLKGHFAKSIGELCEAGVDPPLIRQALVVAVKENKNPKDLVHVVNDLRGGGNGTGRRIGPDRGVRNGRSDGSSF
jgi:hypothetical protein